MRIRTALAALMSLLLVSGASAKPTAEEFTTTIKNKEISRTISGFDKLLRTTKIEANGLQALDGPSVEFLLDIEYKGKNITLIPSDFDYRGIDTTKDGRESRTSIEMASHYEGIPITIYLNYFSLPDTAYLQKSITMQPCKLTAGGMLKRVAIDYWRFRRGIEPVGAGGNMPGPSSGFGVVDTKTGKGFYFLTASRKSTATCSPIGDFVISEEANVPLDKGFESSRATIGAAVGGPEAIYKRSREFALDNYAYNLSRNKKLGSFKKTFEPYFQVCKYIPMPQDVKRINAEAHVVGGRGFIILINSSDIAQKISLPLDNSALGLSGELKLTDWTSLETGSALQTVKAEDKLDLEIAPTSARVIGINIE